MYPGFKFIDVKIYIDTPDQAFGEYSIHQKSGISGKEIHQRFFGHCTVANGKIVLLREVRSTCSRPLMRCSPEASPTSATGSRSSAPSLPTSLPRAGCA
jgi:hypothetical protein